MPVCNQGVSLITTYIPRAGQDFFSTLFPLSEVTPRCRMDVFLNFDHSLHFHGLSMRLGDGCPMLQLDRLLFTQMDHTLYIHESTSIISTCYQMPVPELMIQDSIMTIHSSLRSAKYVNLGRYIRLNQELDIPAMTTVYSTASMGYVSRLYSATLSVLGTTVTAPIELENGVLCLEDNIRVYGVYNTTLRVTAPTNVPWDKQTLRVVGEFHDGTASIIENSVQKFIEEKIRRARGKRENAENSFRRAEGQLNRLQIEYATRNASFNRATISYTEALSDFENATDFLAIAERGLGDANEELVAAQTALDIVCSESDCQDILVNETRCTTCFQAIVENITYECFELEMRQELTLQRVFPDSEYGSCQYVTCCSDMCRFETFDVSTRTCTEVCRGVCKFVVRTEPVYERRLTPVLESARRNCVGQTVAGERAIECCSNVVVSVENTDCKEECRNARQAGLRGLQRSQAQLGAPFQELERARSLLAASRASLAMETLRRDNAMEMRDQLVVPISTARAARDISGENRHMVLEKLEKELMLAEQLDKGIERMENTFTVVKASFNIIIDSRSPTQVPMTIEYESSALVSTRKVNLIFDFVSPPDINLRRVAEVIVSDMFNTTSPRTKRSSNRPRRQVIDLDIIEKSVTQMEFETNCVDHLVLVDFVNQLRDSLNTVLGSNEEAKIELNTSIANLRDKLEEKNGANLDLDTLHDFFNVSADDFARNLTEQAKSSDYKEYLQLLIKTASDSISNIDSSSFAMWQASTEVFYNDIDSILSNPCSGFADCLEVVVSVAERLVNNLPTSTQKSQLIEGLKLFSLKFLSLGTTMDLSIPNAIDAVTNFSLLLQADVVNSYWCSSLPEITVQPPLRVNVSADSDLILNCSATSSLPVFIHWRKNGAPIPSANNYTYTLTGAHMSDSGNYTCVATNGVGSTESLLTNVDVYEVPEFFFVLEPVTTMVGNDSGVLFACNASGFPFHGWRWYFRSDLSRPWTEIADEDTNELAIPSPQFRNQGWYTCEAFNYHGLKRAEAVYLTVLPRTVSQLHLGVKFRLFLRRNFPESVLECTTEDVNRIVLEYLNSHFELGSASIDFLSVSYDSNNTEFAISLVLVSENVTDTRIHTTTFEQIQNRALPSRGDVVRGREIFQGALSRGEFLIMCNDHQLMFSENSLNFDVLTYHCPEGQELSPDFLFCGMFFTLDCCIRVSIPIFYMSTVSCFAGRYPAMTEGVRVFNGRSYKERYPTCQECPVGTFSDEIGMSSCRQCPIHHQTRFQGSSSKVDCFSKLVDCMENQKIDFPF